MARSVSWILRTNEIRKAVEKSARSHFDREEIEFLFDLGKTAAGRLMAALPTERLGRSLLVRRETLEQFLAAADPKLPAGRARTSKRKPRQLERRTFEAIDAASLAPWLGRGVLKETRFANVQQLYDVLWRIACVIEGEGVEAFCALYEPEAGARTHEEGQRDMAALWAELEQMEAARKGPKSEDSGGSLNGSSRGHSSQQLAAYCDTG